MIPVYENASASVAAAPALTHKKLSLYAFLRVSKGTHAYFVMLMRPHCPAAFRAQRIFPLLTGLHSIRHGTIVKKPAGGAIMAEKGLSRPDP